MTVAAAGQLAGNLISVADSDFESALTGNWTVNTGCTLAQSTTQAFSGTHSLAVTLTAATGQINYVKVPGLATTGLVFSAWAYATASGMTGELLSDGYTAGGAFVAGATGATVQNLTQNAWTPLTFAYTTPATSTQQLLKIQFTGANTNVVYVDLVYAAASLWQILAAWQSGPLAATPLYADMTPWVRADQQITYTRGRADETTTVQPGTCQFVLDNSQPGGWFAPSNANAPPGFGGNVTLGKRIQLNAVDETGAWHTRCTCYVTSIQVGWAGGPGLESMVIVQGQDLMAWLGRNNTLRTMLEEEMLLDNPMVLYTLADNTGSKYAVDSSGNANAPLRQFAYNPGGTAGTMAFGGAGMIGFAAPGYTTSPLQAATFTTTVATGSNVQLQGYLPQSLLAGNGFTVECWYTLTVAPGNSGVPFSIAHSKSGAALVVTLFPASNGNVCSLSYYPQVGNPLVSPVVSTLFTLPSASGQLLLVVSGPGTTATLYINNVSVATISFISSGTFTADFVTVGGPAGDGFIVSQEGWTGSLSCFAVFNTALSSGRRAAHYSAGSKQNEGVLISTLVGNILNYESIPAGLQSISAGTSYADAFEITGQTPLSVIQAYQQVDGGVFYTSAAGLLTWQPRTTRYGNQVTPALTLALGQYQEDLSYTTSVQFLIDDTTLGNTNIPGGVRSLNTNAVAANGTYPLGDPGSPQTGPYFSLPYNWPNSAGAAVAQADVLTDAANWESNIYGTPVPRSPNLTVELASQPGGGTNVSRAACYGVDVGSVIQVNGLPASGPGGTRVNFLMAEGLTETFSRDDSGAVWTLAWNTSPASYSAAWIAGDANMGVLDSTAVTGRGTDGNAGSYVGPPYPVPTFAAGMNITGNVGANDMRGLAYNTWLNLHPPCAVAQQQNATQTVLTSTNTDIKWDTLWYDTWGGFGIGTTPTTAYTVQLPGVYLLMAVVAWPVNATGARQAWFQQNGVLIDALEGQGAYATYHFGNMITAQVSCATGDLLKVTGWQNSGSTLTMTASDGGSMFAILWISA